MKNLKPGKRYWFCNCGYIYSGLYGGERDKNGSAFIHQKNGDVWSIPYKDLYQTEKEAERHKYDY